MEEYRLIYDYRDDHEHFGSSSWILLLIAFVLLVYFLVKRASLFKILFASVFFIFILSWIIVVADMEEVKENDFMNSINSGELLTVEGEISNYSPYNFDGHKSDEHFTVNGIYFSYSDGIVRPGYHKTCERGGAICKNGEKVKIQYLSKVNMLLNENSSADDVFHNHIIRLELKTSRK